ncbi:hypothetical protein BGZ70_009699 [Mortierella alpina]|uniref:Uncharacterized protein n=1 Tax=Mortierella alpina TaxID=64518 RepID=A0A9P6J2T9_MORAP|nr:hypothetical protein BGZ70_009699 [Mortierella alpina]
MPATDSMLQPISAPIPVPGTQQEPTTPPVIVIPASLSSLSSMSSSTSEMGATSPTQVSGGSSPVHGVASSPTASGTPRTSMTATRIVSVGPNSNNALHARELGGLSPTSSNANSVNSGSSNGQGGHHGHGQYHHHGPPAHHAPHHPHHNSHHNNPNSGLRRFPSIGNTKKLSVENSTLRAKIMELERYLTGLKEELILAHRQVHAQKLEMRTAEERKAVEMHELSQHIQRCEFELGAKVVECEGLQAKLDEAVKGQDEAIKKVKILEAEVKEAKDGMPQVADASTAETGDLQRRDGDVDDKVRTLQDENTRKDVQIQELLVKVDHLGTEVLKLEREKARLERPTTPIPGNFEEDEDDLAAADARGRMDRNASCSSSSSGTLNSLVPITAEAIIAATTSCAASQPHGVTLVVSGSESSTSLSSTSSTILSEGPHPQQQPSSFVNSVGYDLSMEHSKLLAKFQALRMQHAQASEYLDSLELENEDLKVQLLEVATAPEE